MWLMPQAPLLAGVHCPLQYCWWNAGCSEDRTGRVHECAGMHQTAQPMTTATLLLTCWIRQEAIASV